jgi:hypothetical protein
LPATSSTPLPPASQSALTPPAVSSTPAPPPGVSSLNSPGASTADPEPSATVEFVAANADSLAHEHFSDTGDFQLNGNTLRQVIRWYPLVAGVLSDALFLNPEYLRDEITPALALAIITVESGGSEYALNPKTGAIGLWQVMPQNAKKFGVDPALIADPRVNTRLGAMILRDCFVRKRGNTSKAFRAYGGIKNKENAPRYVESVMLLHTAYKSLLDSINRNHIL